MANLIDLQKHMTNFRDDRDWKQFHNPKDLAQAISIESAELLEHFLWCSQEASVQVVEDNKEAIADEMADVLAYLLSLADIAGIDLEEAFINKLKKNEIKYPVHLAKGTAAKYTKLQENTSDKE